MKKQINDYEIILGYRKSLESGAFLALFVKSQSDRILF